MPRPDTTEYPPYYSRYIELAGDGDILQILERELDSGMRAFRKIPEWDGTYRYAPGKWSVKEMLGHVIDTERVMALRALWFARGGPSPLPGFEQDDWVKNANFDGLLMANLVEEWAMLRRSNVAMFKSLPADAWMRKGTANNVVLSVRALAYIIAGHEKHHRDVLAMRYVR
jgi:hypothetical protein